MKKFHEKKFSNASRSFRNNRNGWQQPQKRKNLNLEERKKRVEGFTLTKTV